ncbi:MAG TPA: 23S rRNA (adenine(2503)-C(2))-methyltransferase RlmN [Dehalococcoidia bacterium]|jgi:23S rRNA (adenine2503-C2)-methyltransferase|nr:23S rRNA (adenine(2503)-C(2))-methyltransferase RlmN [Dehalococcoidia bacterium]HIK89470.1 23S rRNA (adenine(2503)-C(2))-methyltransferase RlmN [Dehalococcoidia bacterium]
MPTSPSTSPEPTAADAPEAPAALPSILDLSRDELTSTLLGMGEKKFRADQLWRSIYNETAESFEDMSTLSKPFRKKLSDHFAISSLTEAMALTSKDRTTSKSLYRLHDGELIETVMMRYESDGHRRNRKTACISTQAGCALGCTFCATGQQGLRRNLTVGEIVAQVIETQRIAYAEDEAQVGSGKRTKGELQGVTNVVFMGMGEPLANYDNTMAAIRVLNDGQGLNIGARHITVSTVGLIPQILQLADEELQINLAISLHAPDNATRSQTMPINKRYPVEDLIRACHKYADKTKRRIFFEYVLLKEQNDSVEQAQKLGRLLNGLHCHVNLIPVNPTKEGPFERTDLTAAKAFQGGLKQYGIPSTLRMEKGIDINAGCGQLRERAIDILGA